MHLHFITALVLSLSATPSFANCEENVASALQHFWQSGPFYFNQQEWNGNFIRQTAGVIIPDEEAEYIEATIQNGYTGDQRIYKEEQSWENDGFGWVGPYLTTWSFSVGVPKSELLPVKIACIDQPKHIENKLEKYSFYVQKFPDSEMNTSVQHTIHLNTADNQITRYERESDENNSINEISNFRFDDNLTIEIPTVDLEKRKQRLIQRYEDEVASTDAECRSKILSILGKAQSSSSFEYEIEGGFWSGVFGIKGIFVSPRSLNYFIEGFPYHGGETEITIIDDQEWRRRKDQEWNGPFISDENSEYGFLNIGMKLMPHSPNLSGLHVGAVKCPKYRQKGNKTYPHSYSYDVFVDFDTGRNKSMNVTMHVDSKTDLPVKFEMRSNELGRVIRKETRRYRSDIKISEPEVIMENRDLVPKLDPLDLLPPLGGK